MADLKTPSMMLVSQEEYEDERRLCCFNIQQKRAKNMSTKLQNSRFFGSSHGWVMVLDERADPYLLNPFSYARIRLPPKETFPHILGVSKGYDNQHFIVDYWYEGLVVRRQLSIKELQCGLVIKGVLSSDPSRNMNSYKVIVIYGYESKLAFFNYRDSSWTDLDGNHGPYSDIMWHNNQLFALSDKGSIEVWDFENPRSMKTMVIQPFFPGKSWRSTEGLYSSRCYLVESSGELLLVVRYVGEFVGHDGVPVYEADLLTDEDTHPLVCPYRTLQFHVYKLSFIKNKWVEVDGLEDRALFVGGNHSMSISALDFPECKKNSIYFTDDYLERINEDYLYGGHDLGVFSLEDSSVEPFYPCDSERIEPPPIWLVPTPCVVIN
ncbi:unnamed protein product [Ilex paraguariensis]|uniref:KIB1-4 beta-propeller domain-containing protein n=1 Tax=Ilex paraguariensis TaxID=185542 RepID=A0ABC8TLD3_9AQUA